MYLKHRVYQRLFMFEFFIYFIGNYLNIEKEYKTNKLLIFYKWFSNQLYFVCSCFEVFEYKYFFLISKKIIIIILKKTLSFYI